VKGEGLVGQQRVEHRGRGRGRGGARALLVRKVHGGGRTVDCLEGGELTTQLRGLACLGSGLAFRVKARASGLRQGLGRVGLRVSGLRQGLGSQVKVSG
jgi:hypothetical protein